MILTVENLAYYLLDRGLISPQSLVDGDFVATAAQNRHASFRVIRRAAPGYFLKQQQGQDPQALATLQREAACYNLFHSSAAFAGLTRRIPRYHLFDATYHILVLELLPDAEDLGRYHQRLGGFPEDLGHDLGFLLAACHRHRHLSEDAASLFPRQLPWVLASEHLTQFLAGSPSTASGRVLEIAEGYPEFRTALQTLRADWCRDTLIHGDLKLTNCVRYTECDGNDRILLVDWELADLGDAAWDLGGLLQSYLALWVLSMPIAPDTPTEQLIARAPFGLEDMQPLFRALWRSYQTSRGLQGPSSTGLLIRSVRSAGARMIQTAFELMSRSHRLEAPALYLLQLSLNILTNPEPAIRHLFGFEEAEA